MQQTPDSAKPRRRYFDRDDSTPKSTRSSSNSPPPSNVSSNKEIGSVSNTKVSVSSSPSTASISTFSPTTRSDASSALSDTAVTPLSPPVATESTTDDFSAQSPMSTSSLVSNVLKEEEVAQSSNLVVNSITSDRESIGSITSITSVVTVDDAQKSNRNSYSYGTIYGNPTIDTSDEPDDSSLPHGVSAKRGSSSFTTSNPLYLSSPLEPSTPSSASTTHYTTPTSMSRADKLTIFSPAATTANPLKRSSSGGILRSAIMNNYLSTRSSGTSTSPKILSWDKSVSDDSSDRSQDSPSEGISKSSGYYTDASNDDTSVPSPAIDLSKELKDYQNELRNAEQCKNAHSLHEAIQLFGSSLDMAWLSDVLDKNPEKAKERDTLGRLPLHYACLMPRSAVARETTLRLLLAYPDGLFVREKTEKRFTPLHHYVAHGHREEVILEEIGSIIENVETSNSFTPEPYFPYGNSLLTALLALHAATTENAASGLPSQVARYEVVRECVLQVISFFPNQVRQMDKQDGFFPLHDSLMLECENDIVIALVETYPDAVKVVVKYDKDNGGGLPLHDALRKGYDIQIIRKMVEVYPESLLLSETMVNRSNKTFLSKPYVESDNLQQKGNYPLHIALKSSHYRDGSDVSLSDGNGIKSKTTVQQVIETLLHFHPRPHRALQELDEDHNLPIHLLFLHHGEIVTLPLLQLFIASCPKTVGMKNKSGFLPLHLAVRHVGRIDKSIVLKLLDIYPPAIQEVSVDGSLPLHVAISSCTLKPAVLSAPTSTSISRSTSNLLEDSTVLTNKFLDLLHLLLDYYPDSISAVNIYSYLPLHIAIVNHVPFSVLEMILTQWPESAERRVKYGDYAFHLAISAKAPIEVLRLLLEAYPKAVEMLNAYGNLPLHYALLHRCKVEVIQFILVASTLNSSMADISSSLSSGSKKTTTVQAILKTKNVYGNTPLHIALIQQAPLLVIQTILLLCSDATSIKNNQGLLPLHIALTSPNISHDIVHTLISAYPQACMTRLGKSSQNIEDNFPLHAYLLLNAHPSVTVIQLLMTAFPNAINEKCGKDALLPIHIAIQRGLSLDIINCLLEFNPASISMRSGPNSSKDSSSGDLPLHFALSRKTLSWDTIHRLVELYPTGLREANGLGDYPLHLAAIRLFDNSLQQPIMSPERMHTFYQILEAEQEVASCCNHEHNLCLHILLQCCTRSIDSNRFTEVIMRTVKIFPDAVLEVDSTGLLPLALAIRQGAPFAVINRLSELTPEPLTVYAKVPLLYSAADSIRAPCQPNNQVERITLLALVLLQPLLISTDHLLEINRISLQKVLHIIQLNPTAIALLTSVTCNIPMHIAAHNHYYFDHPLDFLKNFHQAFPTGVQKKNASSLLPLHEALIGGKSNAMFEVIEFLVQIYPESVRCKTSEGNYPLHVAIANECPFPVIKLLLREFPEAIQIMDNCDRLPLHIALNRSYSCSSDLVEFLFKAYPDATDIKDSQGNFPLHLIVQNKLFLQSPGSFQIVEAIIKSNSQVLQETDNKGSLPLHLLCETIGHCDSNGNLTINMGASSGNGERNSVFKESLLKIFNLVLNTYPNACEVQDNNLCTSLHLLLQSGCLTTLMNKFVVSILGICQTVATIVDGKGQLPLHVACQHYSGSSFQVETDDDEDDGESRDDSNREFCTTATAIKGVSLGVIERLLCCYVDGLKVVDKEGKSALHHAIQYHSTSLELIDLLVEYGALSDGKSIVEQRDANGYFPVQFALIHRSSTNVLQSLLSKSPGCINMLSDEGFSSLSLAIMHNCDYETIAFVMNLDPSAISRKVGSEGNLPLHLAVARNNSSLEVVRLLISLLPQSIRVQNNDGNLALHLAMLHNAPLEVIQMLIMIYPEGCSILNDAGHLPLHIALEYDAGLDSIELIAATSLQSIVTKTRAGLLPLQILAQKSNDGNRHKIIEEIFLKLSNDPSTMESIEEKPGIQKDSSKPDLSPSSKNKELQNLTMSEPIFDLLYPYLLRSIFSPTVGTGSNKLSGGVIQQQALPTNGTLHHSFPSSFLIVDYKLEDNVIVSGRSEQRRVDQVLSYLNKLCVFVECMHDMIVQNPAKYFANSSNTTANSVFLLSMDNVIHAFSLVYHDVFGNQCSAGVDETMKNGSFLLASLSKSVDEIGINRMEDGFADGPAMFLYLIDEWTLRPIHQSSTGSNSCGINLIEWLAHTDNTTSTVSPSPSSSVDHSKRMSILVYLLLMFVWLHKVSTKSVAVMLNLLGLETDTFLSVLTPPTSILPQMIDNNHKDCKELLELQNVLTETLKLMSKRVEMVFDCFDRLVRLEKRQTLLKLCSRSLKDLQELLRHTHRDSVGACSLHHSKSVSVESIIVPTILLSPSIADTNKNEVLSNIVKVEVENGGNRKYIWVGSNTQHALFVSGSDSCCLLSKYWDSLEKLKLTKLVGSNMELYGRCTTNEGYFSCDQWRSLLEEFAKDYVTSEKDGYLSKIQQFFTNRFLLRVAVEVIFDLCDVLFGSGKHNAVHISHKLNKNGSRDGLKTLKELEDLNTQGKVNGDFDKIDLVSFLLNNAGGTSNDSTDNRVPGYQIIQLCLLCSSSTSMESSFYTDVSSKGDEKCSGNIEETVKLMSLITLEDLEKLFREKEIYLLDSLLSPAIGDNVQKIENSPVTKVPLPIVSCNMLLKVLIAACVSINWLPEGVLHSPSSLSTYEPLASKDIIVVRRKLQAVIHHCEQLTFDPLATSSLSVLKCEDSVHKYLAPFGILEKDATSGVTIAKWTPGDTICYSFYSIPVFKRSSSTSFCGCDAVDDEEIYTNKGACFSLEVCNTSSHRDNEPQGYAVLKISQKSCHPMSLHLSLKQINRIIAIFWDFLIDHTLSFEDISQKEHLVKVFVDYKPVNKSEAFANVLEKASNGLFGVTKS